MDLNIRDFPDELWKELKSKSGAIGLSLREYVIQCVKVELNLLTVEGRKGSLAKKPPVKVRTAATVPSSTVAEESVPSVSDYVETKWMGPPHSATCHCQICTTKRWK